MGVRGNKSALDVHPRKAFILKDLVNPLMTNRSLAAKWQVHIRTIENWKSRTKGLLSLARHNNAELTRDELMADVQEIYNDGRELVAQAKSKGDIKGGAAVMMAMLGTVKLKGEASGQLRPEGQRDQQGVNIQMLIGMPRSANAPMREGEGDSNVPLDEPEAIDIEMDE